jgi:hypothetical protein
LSDEFFDVIRALVDADARFVVVGGVALLLHGATYSTLDLDIAYERTRENAMHIAAAIRPLNPRPRGFPAGLPFVFDAQTILSTQILTLQTDVCDLDLLGEIPGIGTFAQVDAAAQDFRFEGLRFRVLSIDGLITAKGTANRPKDQPGLVELRALRDARNLDRAAAPPEGRSTGSSET